jgi:hypothetical protein
MGKSPECIDCLKDEITTWRQVAGKPPRCATHRRKMIKDRRAKAHTSHVQRTYGISGEEYLALKKAQNGLCAICGPWTGRNGRYVSLSVDHNHRTGEVRGLLCRVCNRILGLFRDNPEAFRRAADYLTEPPARKVLTEMRNND